MTTTSDAMPAPEALLITTTDEQLRNQLLPERPYYGFDDFLLYGLVPEGTAPPVDVVHPHPDAEYAALLAQFEAWARLPAAAYTGHL